MLVVMAYLCTCIENQLLSFHGSEFVHVFYLFPHMCQQLVLQQILQNQVSRILAAIEDHCVLTSEVEVLYFL